MMEGENLLRYIISTFVNVTMNPQYNNNMTKNNLKNKTLIIKQKMCILAHFFNLIREKDAMTVCKIVDYLVFCNSYAFFFQNSSYR
jgi:hypothetical protein